MTPRLVQVFRSARHEGMYLIVDRARGMADVPEALMKRFGAAEPSLVFQLQPGRALARADAATVLEAIERQGFYLQLPPEGTDPEGEALAAWRSGEDHPVA